LGRVIGEKGLEQRGRGEENRVPGSSRILALWSIVCNLWHLQIANATEFIISICHSLHYVREG